jgi:hypothetical protein
MTIFLLALVLIGVPVLIWMAYCDLNCECANYDDCPMHPDEDDAP